MAGKNFTSRIEVSTIFKSPEGAGAIVDALGQIIGQINKLRVTANNSIITQMGKTDFGKLMNQFVLDFKKSFDQNASDLELTSLNESVLNSMNEGAVKFIENLNASLDKNVDIEPLRKKLSEIRLTGIEMKTPTGEVFLGDVAKAVDTVNSTEKLISTWNKILSELPQLNTKYEETLGFSKAMAKESIVAMDFWKMLPVQIRLSMEEIAKIDKSIVKPFHDTLQRMFLSANEMRDIDAKTKGDYGFNRLKKDVLKITKEISEALVHLTHTNKMLQKANLDPSVFTHVMEYLNSMMDFLNYFSNPDKIKDIDTNYWEKRVKALEKPLKAMDKYVTKIMDLMNKVGGKSAGTKVMDTPRIITAMEKLNNTMKIISEGGVNAATFKDYAEGIRAFAGALRELYESNKIVDSGEKFEAMGAILSSMINYMSAIKNAADGVKDMYTSFSNLTEVFAGINKNLDEIPIDKLDAIGKAISGIVVNVQGAAPFDMVPMAGGIPFANMPDPTAYAKNFADLSNVIVNARANISDNVNALVAIFERLGAQHLSEILNPGKTVINTTMGDIARSIDIKQQMGSILSGVQTEFGAFDNLKRAIDSVSDFIKSGFKTAYNKVSDDTISLKDVIVKNLSDIEDLYRLHLTKRVSFLMSYSEKERDAAKQAWKTLSVRDIEAYGLPRDTKKKIIPGLENLTATLTHYKTRIESLADIIRKVIQKELSTLDSKGKIKELYKGEISGEDIATRLFKEMSPEEMHGDFQAMGERALGVLGELMQSLRQVIQVNTAGIQKEFSILQSNLSAQLVDILNKMRQLMEERENLLALQKLDPGLEEHRAEYIKRYEQADLKNITVGERIDQIETSYERLSKSMEKPLLKIKANAEGYKNSIRSLGNYTKETIDILYDLFQIEVSDTSLAKKLAEMIDVNAIKAEIDKIDKAAFKQVEKAVHVQKMTPELEERLIRLNEIKNKQSELKDLELKSYQLSIKYGKHLSEQDNKRQADIEALTATWKRSMLHTADAMKISYDELKNIISMSGGEIDVVTARVKALKASILQPSDVDAFEMLARNLGIQEEIIERIIPLEADRTKITRESLIQSMELAKGFISNEMIEKQKAFNDEVNKLGTAEAEAVKKAHALIKSITELSNLKDELRSLDKALGKGAYRDAASDATKSRFEELVKSFGIMDEKGLETFRESADARKNFYENFTNIIGEKSSEAIALINKTMKGTQAIEIQKQQEALLIQSQLVKNFEAQVVSKEESVNLTSKENTQLEDIISKYNKINELQKVGAGLHTSADARIPSKSIYEWGDFQRSVDLYRKGIMSEEDFSQHKDIMKSYLLTIREYLSLLIRSRDLGGDISEEMVSNTIRQKNAIENMITSYSKYEDKLHASAKAQRAFVAAMREKGIDLSSMEAQTVFTGEAAEGFSIKDLGISPKDMKTMNESLEETDALYEEVTESAKDYTKAVEEYKKLEKEAPDKVNLSEKARELREARKKDRENLKYKIEGEEQYSEKVRTLTAESFKKAYDNVNKIKLSEEEILDLIKEQGIYRKAPDLGTATIKTKVPETANVEKLRADIIDIQTHVQILEQIETNLFSQQELDEGDEYVEVIERVRAAIDFLEQSMEKILANSKLFGGDFITESLKMLPGNIASEVEHVRAKLEAPAIGGKGIGQFREGINTTEEALFRYKNFAIEFSKLAQSFSASEEPLKDSKSRLISLINSYGNIFEDTDKIYLIIKSYFDKNKEALKDGSKSMETVITNIKGILQKEVEDMFLSSEKTIEVSAEKYKELFDKINNAIRLFPIEKSKLPDSTFSIVDALKKGEKISKVELINFWKTIKQGWSDYIKEFNAMAKNTTTEDAFNLLFAKAKVDAGKYIAMMESVHKLTTKEGAKPVDVGFIKESLDLISLDKYIAKAAQAKEANKEFNETFEQQTTEAKKSSDGLSTYTQKLDAIAKSLFVTKEFLIQSLLATGGDREKIASLVDNLVGRLESYNTTQQNTTQTQTQSVNVMQDFANALGQLVNAQQDIEKSEASSTSATQASTKAKKEKNKVIEEESELLKRAKAEIEKYNSASQKTLERRSRFSDTKIKHFSSKQVNQFYNYMKELMDTSADKFIVQWEKAKEVIESVIDLTSFASKFSKQKPPSKIYDTTTFSKHPMGGDFYKTMQVQMKTYMSYVAMLQSSAIPLRKRHNIITKLTEKTLAAVSTTEKKLFDTFKVGFEKMEQELSTKKAVLAGLAIASKDDKGVKTLEKEISALEENIRLYKYKYQIQAEQLNKFGQITKKDAEYNEILWKQFKLQEKTKKSSADATAEKEKEGTAKKKVVQAVESEVKAEKRANEGKQQTQKTTKQTTANYQELNKEVLNLLQNMQGFSSKGKDSQFIKELAEAIGSLKVNLKAGKVDTTIIDSIAKIVESLSKSSEKAKDGINSLKAFLDMMKQLIELLSLLSTTKGKDGKSPIGDNIDRITKEMSSALSKMKVSMDTMLKEVVSFNKSLDKAFKDAGGAKGAQEQITVFTTVLHTFVGALSFSGEMVERFINNISKISEVKDIFVGTMAEMGKAINMLVSNMSGVGKGSKVKFSMADITAGLKNAEAAFKIYSDVVNKSASDTDNASKKMKDISSKLSTEGLFGEGKTKGFNKDYEQSISDFITILEKFGNKMYALFGKTSKPGEYFAKILNSLGNAARAAKTALVDLSVESIEGDKLPALFEKYAESINVFIEKAGTKHFADIPKLLTAMAKAVMAFSHGVSTAPENIDAFGDALERLSPIIAKVKGDAAALSGAAQYIDSISKIFYMQRALMESSKTGGATLGDDVLKDYSKGAENISKTYTNMFTKMTNAFNKVDTSKLKEITNLLKAMKGIILALGKDLEVAFDVLQNKSGMLTGILTQMYDEVMQFANSKIFSSGTGGKGGGGAEEVRSRLDEIIKVAEMLRAAASVISQLGKANDKIKDNATLAGKAIVALGNELSAFPSSLKSGEILNDLGVISKTLESIVSLSATLSTSMATAFKSLAPRKGTKDISMLTEFLQKVRDSVKEFYSELDSSDAKSANWLSSLAKLIDSLNVLQSDLSNAKTAIENVMSQINKSFGSTKGKDAGVLAGFGALTTGISSLIESLSQLEKSDQIKLFTTRTKKETSKAGKVFATLTEFIDNIGTSLSKTFSGKDAGGIKGIAELFKGLGSSITAIARDLEPAYKILNSDTKMLESVLSAVRKELSKFAGEEIKNAGAALGGLAKYINAVNKASKDLGGKSSSVISSLSGIATVLPSGTIASPQALNSIANYVNSLKGVSDAIKQIAALSDTNLQKFRQNIQNLVPMTQQLKNNLAEIAPATTRATGQIIKTTNKTKDHFMTLKKFFRYIFMGSGIYFMVRRVRQFIQDLIREVTAVEAAFVNFRAISGATEKQMDALRQGVANVSSNFGYMMSEIGKASVTLAKAGIKAKDVASSLYAIATLARAAMEEMEIATKIAVIVMKAYKMEGNEMMEVTNHLTAMLLNSKLTLEDMQTQLSYVSSTAAAAGISFQDLGVALAVMSNSGLKASQVGTSLRGIIGVLLSPNNRLLKVLKSIGVTAEEVNPATNKLIDIFERLNDAGFDVQKVYSAMDRRIAQGTVSLVSNVHALKEMEFALTNSAPAIQIAMSQMSSFENATKRITATMQKGLTPTFNYFLERAAVMMNGLAVLENRYGVLTKAVKLAGYAVLFMTARAIGLTSVEAIKNGAIVRKLTEYYNKLGQQAMLLATKEKELVLTKMWQNNATYIGNKAMHESISNHILSGKSLSQLTLEQKKYFISTMEANSGTATMNKTFKYFEETTMTTRQKMVALGKSIGLALGKFLLIIIAVQVAIKVFQAITEKVDQHLNTFGKLANVYKNAREATDAYLNSMKEANEYLGDASKSSEQYELQLKSIAKSLKSVTYYEKMRREIESSKDVDVTTEEGKQLMKDIAEAQYVSQATGIKIIADEEPEKLKKAQGLIKRLGYLMDIAGKNTIKDKIIKNTVAQIPLIGDLFKSTAEDEEKRFRGVYELTEDLQSSMGEYAYLLENAEVIEEAKSKLNKTQREELDKQIAILKETPERQKEIIANAKQMLLLDLQRYKEANEKGSGETPYSYDSINLAKERLLHLLREEKKLNEDNMDTMTVQEKLAYAKETTEKKIQIATQRKKMLEEMIAEQQQEGGADAAQNIKLLNKELDNTEKELLEVENIAKTGFLKYAYDVMAPLYNAMHSVEEYGQAAIHINESVFRNFSETMKDATGMSLMHRSVIADMQTNMLTTENKLIGSMKIVNEQITDRAERTRALNSLMKKFVTEAIQTNLKKALEDSGMYLEDYEAMIKTITDGWGNVDLNNIETASILFTKNSREAAYNFAQINDELYKTLLLLGGAEQETLDKLTNFGSVGVAEDRNEYAEGNAEKSYNDLEKQLNILKRINSSYTSTERHLSRVHSLSSATKDDSLDWGKTLEDVDVSYANMIQDLSNFTEDNSVLAYIKNMPEIAEKSLAGMSGRFEKLSKLTTSWFGETPLSGESNADYFAKANAIMSAIRAIPAADRTVDRMMNVIASTDSSFGSILGKVTPFAKSFELALKPYVEAVASSENLVKYTKKRLEYETKNAARIKDSVDNLLKIKQLKKLEKKETADLTEMEKKLGGEPKTTNRDAYKNFIDSQKEEVFNTKTLSELESVLAKVRSQNIQSTVDGQKTLNSLLEQGSRFESDPQQQERWVRFKEQIVKTQEQGLAVMASTEESDDRQYQAKVKKLEALREEISMREKANEIIEKRDNALRNIEQTELKIMEYETGGTYEEKLKTAEELQKTIIETGKGILEMQQGYDAASIDVQEMVGGVSYVNTAYQDLVKNKLLESGIQDDINKSSLTQYQLLVDISGALMDIRNALLPKAELDEEGLNTQQKIANTMEAINSVTERLKPNMEDIVKKSGQWQKHISDVSSDLKYIMLNLNSIGALENINIKIEAEAEGEGHATGGYIKKLAGGGLVMGAGKFINDMSDKIPAFLSNREYVINSFSTRMFKPLLDMINYKPMTAKKKIGSMSDFTGQIINNINTGSKYATGGIVQPPAQVNNNLRPVVLVVDNNKYQMYSDDEVANKVIRALQKRSKTRK